MTEIAGERIFITGGLGFIGATLCSRLVEGNQLTVYDNFRRNALRHTPVWEHPNLTVVKGSVLDEDLLRASMLRAEPSIVIHLAAITGITTYRTFPIRTVLTNMGGTMGVLDCAIEHELKRFVNFSSSEVYGPDVREAKEDGVTMLGPVGSLRWTYASSKTAAEHLCMAYHGKRQMPVVSIRPFNIYGPLQVGEGAIHSFISAALANEDLQINGDGSQVRAWCYVSDLMDAVLMAMSEDAAVGEVLNVGNRSTEITILDLAKKVIELVGATSQLRYEPDAPVEITFRSPCVDKARQVLGFEAKVGLDAGLRKTIEWYRATGAGGG